jgi:rhamnosyltransferase
MTACSIVIRAFDEEKHIGRLLEGIRQQTIKDIEILLVDSGSSDRTVDIARQFGAMIVHIKPEDFSFGRALNRGIEKSGSEIIVIASAHVYPVYPDWLERLLEPFKDPKVALTYGKQRGTADSQFSEKQIFIHWYPDHSAARQAHPFCNNANAAIRRSMWTRQAYNESLPALEDLEWARWAYEQGSLITYSAEAEVIHVHHESWQGIQNRYRREGMAFKQIYPHEHFHWWNLVGLWIGNVINDFSAAISQKCFRSSWSDIINFRWRQFWGTYLGYHQSGPLTWKLKQAFYYPQNLSRIEISQSVSRMEPISYHKSKPVEPENPDET